MSGSEPNALGIMCMLLIYTNVQVSNIHVLCCSVITHKTTLKKSVQTPTITADIEDIHLQAADPKTSSRATETVQMCGGFSLIVPAIDCLFETTLYFLC